jgi:hypothetical protein
MTRAVKQVFVLIQNGTLRYVATTRCGNASLSECLAGEINCNVLPQFVYWAYFSTTSVHYSDRKLKLPGAMVVHSFSLGGSKPFALGNDRKWYSTGDISTLPHVCAIGQPSAEALSLVHVHTHG